MYDRDRSSHPWDEHVELRRDEVLGTDSLDTSVKLLESDCTLPKELDFRDTSDDKLIPLLSYEGRLS